MPNIFARAPYLISIAQNSQNGSKLELFFSATTSFALFPDYTLSKLIPASNNVLTIYDISPYIREYITFLACSAGGNAAATNPTNERVNVKVKRYAKIGANYVFIDTATYIGFDGYGYYEDGFNKDLGIFGLDAGTYYYNPTSDPGKIRITGGASFTAKYTSFDLVPVINSLSISNGTYDIPRVRTTPNNLLVGNKVEILGANLSVFITYYFYPLEECKYTPVIIDFVNKYGAWQREFFFKASNDTLSVENTEYNLLQTNSFNYNVLEGQRKVFNANGKKSIKVNTGWVYESWNEVLKQIMLSERILIDDKPAKINTKSTELFKNINTKQINYSLEFEFAYDVINSVI